MTNLIVILNLTLTMTGYHQGYLKVNLIFLGETLFFTLEIEKARYILIRL